MSFGVNTRADAAGLKARVRAVTYDWSDGPTVRLFAYLEECTGGDSFHLAGSPDEVKSAIEALGAAYRQWEEAGRPAPAYEVPAL